MPFVLQCVHIADMSASSTCDYLSLDRWRKHQNSRHIWQNQTTNKEISYKRTTRRPTAPTMKRFYLLVIFTLLIIVISTNADILVYERGSSSVCQFRNNDLRYFGAPTKNNHSFQLFMRSPRRNSTIYQPDSVHLFQRMECEYWPLNRYRKMVAKIFRRHQLQIDQRMRMQDGLCWLQGWYRHGACEKSRNSLLSPI